MSCDTKSYPLSNDKEFTEKSVNEDSHLNSRVQTAISQNVAKCKSALTSIDNDGIDCLFVVEKAKMEENQADKTISIVDKENNSKEEKSHTCFGNILEKAFNSSTKSEDLKGSKSKKRSFSLLDTLISTSIVAPLAIGFWRGVWGYMDHHAKLFPSWFCFMFGAALHATYTIFKDRFHNVYMKKWAKSHWRKRLLYRILQVVYTYTFGLACIAHWRGGWIIIDNYLFMHSWIMTSLTCSLLTCLAILRSVRNLIATPMIILIDAPSCVFQFPTRYNVVS